MAGRIKKMQRFILWTPPFVQIQHVMVQQHDTA